MNDQQDHDQRPPVPAWAVERLMEQAAEIAKLRAAIEHAREANRNAAHRLSELEHRATIAERNLAIAEREYEQTKAELAEAKQRVVDLAGIRESCIEETGRLRAALRAAEQARAEAERRAEEILATVDNAHAHTEEVRRLRSALAAAQQRIAAHEAELDAARDWYANDLRSQLTELATATRELAEARTAKQRLERRIADALARLRRPPNGDAAWAIHHATLILEGGIAPDEDVLPPPQGEAQS